MKILINNNFVNEKEAQISLLSDAVMYGYGLFETLRTYSQKRTLKLDDHIYRLINSAQKINLQLKYGFEEIEKMIIRVIKQSKHELQRVKILAIPDSLIIISTKLKLDKKNYNGVSIKTAIHKRSLPHLKSTSYLDCLLHYNDAIETGFFDALFIDESNYIYECTRSNIYWISKNKIFTRKNEVLPGITRNVVKEISHLPFKYKNGKLSDLLDADEIFISNSVMGLAPVTKLNDTNISFSNPGKCTLQLMQDFNDNINSL